jgi:ELWxxDGT repeat protein
VNTYIVKDIRPGTASSGPNYLTNFGGTLYFGAYGPTGAGLWKSNGTDPGTVEVKKVGVSNLIVGNGQMFFAGDISPNGTELWKSDGTGPNTIAVKDIHTGGIGSFPREIVAVGATVFFVADDGVHGEELWKTNGTDPGTVLVKDILPGAAGSDPSELTSFGGALYFAASDGSHGREMWKSNGTGLGTVMVKDILRGGKSSGPQNFKVIGSRLYFSAADEPYGRELWAAQAQVAPVMRPMPRFSRGTTRQVAWDPIPGASEFYLEWSTDRSFTKNVQNSGWITPNGTTVINLNDGTTYYYHAKLRVGMVEGPFGDVAFSRQDATSPTAQGVPTDGGAFTSSTSVRFNWTPALDLISGVVSYDLEIGTTPGGNNVFAGNAGNAWTRAFTGSNGQTYYARVRAHDDVGNIGQWSGNSDGITVDTIAPTVPGTPTDAGVYTSSTSVRFNWTAATDAGSGVAAYVLQVGTTPGGSNVFNASVGNVLTRNVTGANGQTVYARIRARDGAGNLGAWSGNSNGITVDTVKPSFTGLTVRDYGQLDVTFGEAVNNADQAGNYSCTRGLKIISASKLSNTQYHLTTSYQTQGTSYTLTVGSGVKDRAGNPLNPASSSRAFVGGKVTGADAWRKYR